jgi:hypothetical protein
MQPDLVGADEEKEIGQNAFRELLQLRRLDLFPGKDQLDEHGWFFAPVSANTMIDPRYKRIVRILCSQPIDTARNFLADGRFIENDRHQGSSQPLYRVSDSDVVSKRNTREHPGGKARSMKYAPAIILTIPA